MDDLILIIERPPCCGCRPEAEVRDELRWKQRLAKEGWNKEIGSVRRRIQERQYGNKWTREMELAIRRFQPTCVICGVADDLTTHHVQPLCLGHGLDVGNAVTLCRSCNSSIGGSKPCNLPPDMARKLETAAAQFKEHWESGCATPAAPTAAPAEETLKPLITLLRAVECGDDTAIPALADWLEERGDPRTSAIREVARWEAVDRETETEQTCSSSEFRYIGGGRWQAVVTLTRTGATRVHHSIEFLLDGKRCGPSISVTRSSEETEDSIAKRIQEARRRLLSDEVWMRLGVKRDLMHTLKPYLGLNPTGLRATPEEIAQQWNKRVQTIRSKINRALYLLTCSEVVVVKPRYGVYSG